MKKPIIILFSSVSVLLTALAVAVTWQPLGAGIKGAAVAVILALVMLLQYNIIRLWELGYHLMGPQDEHAILTGILTHGRDVFAAWQTMNDAIQDAFGDDVQVILWMKVRTEEGGRMALGKVQIDADHQRVTFPEAAGGLFLPSGLAMSLGLARFLSPAGVAELAQDNTPVLADSLIFGLSNQQDYPIFLQVKLGKRGVDEGQLDENKMPLIGILVLAAMFRLYLTVAYLRDRLYNASLGYDSDAGIAQRRMVSFIQIVLHELNTPFSFIKNALTVLRLRASSGGQIGAHEVMDTLSDADAGFARVDRLLDKARLYFDSITDTSLPKSQPTKAIYKELIAVSKASHASLRKRMKTDSALRAIHGGRVPNIELARFPREAQGKYVRFSPVLSSALRELIDNALQYNNGETPVSIALKADAGQLSIKICNAGEIPQSTLGAFRSGRPVAFLSDALRHGSAHAGIGLGLLIAKAAIEEHEGGRLSLQVSNGYTCALVSLDLQDEQTPLRGAFYASDVPV